ncbi:MAG: helix-turn-helix domain-containing protein [Mycobacteriales bacterium]
MPSILTPESAYSPGVDPAPKDRRQPPEQVIVLAHGLLAELEAMTDRLVKAVLAEDPSYGQGRTTRDDLRRSCRDNLERILQTLSGLTPAADADHAPRATGRRRAEQGMPLESVLHAYRLGHRIIWDSLVSQARDENAVAALVQAASHVWELVDSFSSAAASAYRETERLIHGRDAEHRDAVLDALFEGRGRERAVAAEAAAALDLPERGTYAVLVLGGTETGQAVSDALSARGMRLAWRTRADREIALIALGRVSPAELITALGRVPTLRAGLSPPVEGFADVDAAHRLAETALRAFPPTQRGVSELDARLPGALLVTAPDLAGRLIERALGGVLALDEDERDMLLQTLAAWLATGGSAGQTARRLYCHRNTVLNRMRRLESLTGRSVERLDDLVEWSLALLARELLPNGASDDA